MNSRELFQKAQKKQLEEEKERKKKWDGMGLRELCQIEYKSHALNHYISERKRKIANGERNW